MCGVRLHEFLPQETNEVASQPVTDALHFKTNASIRRMATIPHEDPPTLYPARVEPHEPTVYKVRDVDSHDQEDKQQRRPGNGTHQT